MRLEKSLHARLFDRRAQGYSLTMHGERLLELAQKMEALAMSVVTEVGGSRLSVAGTVRIGATDGFGTVFLARRLPTLRDQHPNLILQLVTLPRIFSLSKREADIAIGLSRPTEGRLHARKLTDYTLGLYASKRYLSKHPVITDQRSFHQHRFIGYIDDLIYTPELDYLSLISRELDAAFTSSNLIAQFQATLAGGGLCVLPNFMAAKEPRLQRVLPSVVALTRSFWLIVHSDMKDLARVRTVSEFIVREVRAAHDLFMPSEPLS